jgi:hypothetical protein
MKKFFIAAGVVVLLTAFATTAGVSADTVLAKRGSEVDGTLQQTLNSKTNHDGDTFVLIQRDTFFHHAEALHGATIDGHLENVSPAGPTHKATMLVVFDDIKLPDGSTVPIDPRIKSLSTFEPHTHHIRDVGLIVGGAVAGHMMAGKKHGGLAGAAAGFALSSTLKSDINVKKGTLVKLVMRSDVVSTGAQPAASPM